MDYETHPTSRAKVRLYAKMFRKLFGLSLYGSVNPIMLLDKVNKVFSDVDYEIVEEAWKEVTKLWVNKLMRE